MDVLGYSEVRAKLAAVLESVVTDSNPIVVFRPKGRSVVLVSLADWTARQGRLTKPRLRS
jgi:prevent-host-death family protein